MARGYEREIPIERKGSFEEHSLSRAFELRKSRVETGGALGAPSREPQDLSILNRLHIPDPHAFDHSPPLSDQSRVHVANDSLAHPDAFLKCFKAATLRHCDNGIL
jgi:hypothetical protein